MTQITHDDIQSIGELCRQNAAAITEALNLCLECSLKVKVGATSSWIPTEAPDELDGPGLTLEFQVGEQGVLCLIPQALPLPEWYAAPDESEAARLQELTSAWSQVMLPQNLEGKPSQPTASANLKQQIVDAEPAEWAELVELLVFESGTTEADESDETGDDATAEPEATARLFLIAAVNRTALTKTSAEPEAASPSDAVATALSTVDRQMLELPITVSVRLAEKKIELEQLVSLTPGSLVTFNKGCESLLDLYVNNHLYGRGEAIKIGEKFGLKVTQVGTRTERKPRVM